MSEQASGLAHRAPCRPRSSVRSMCKALVGSCHDAGLGVHNSKLELGVAGNVFSSDSRENTRGLVGSRRIPYPAGLKDTRSETGNA